MLASPWLVVEADGGTRPSAVSLLCLHFNRLG